MGLEPVAVQCPYCWEQIDLLVELPLDDAPQEQRYVEDCSVCCHPMEITVHSEAGVLLSMDVRSDSA